MEDRYARVRTVKPTTRGRITIPAEFRRELGLSEGCLIEITFENGRIAIHPFVVPEEIDAESDPKAPD